MKTNPYVAIVIPKSIQVNIMQFIHESVGHANFEKCLEFAKDNKYWWSSIGKDMKEYIYSCKNCQINNRLTKLPYGTLGVTYT